MIYPTTNLGVAADLHAEATNLFPMTGRRFNQAIAESRSVCSTQALLTRVLLLLRCGETEAALKNWAPDPQMVTRVPAERRPAGSARGETESYDPYLELAGDWAWALFDHLISAHKRVEGRSGSCSRIVRRIPSSPARSSSWASNGVRPVSNS